MISRHDEHPGPIGRLLGGDHARLDALLARAADDSTAYTEFRRGLLRHIAMEEKVLLPAAQRAGGGGPLPQAATLRQDHGALAALLVPTPTSAILAALRGILTRHNALEEGPDGVYAACERLVGDEIVDLVVALRAVPQVPMRPHVDSDVAMNALRRALARAGYVLESFQD
jgi:hypothetical protein